MVLLTWCRTGWDASAGQSPASAEPSRPAQPNGRIFEIFVLACSCYDRHSNCTTSFYCLIPFCLCSLLFLPVKLRPRWRIGAGEATRQSQSQQQRRTQRRCADCWSGQTDVPPAVCMCPRSLAHPRCAGRDVRRPLLPAALCRCVGSPRPPGCQQRGGSFIVAAADHVANSAARGQTMGVGVHAVGSAVVAAASLFTRWLSGRGKLTVAALRLPLLLPLHSLRASFPPPSAPRTHPAAWCAPANRAAPPSPSQHRSFDERQHTQQTHDRRSQRCSSRLQRGHSRCNCQAPLLAQTHHAGGYESHLTDAAISWWQHRSPLSQRRVERDVRR